MNRYIAITAILLLIIIFISSIGFGLKSQTFKTTSVYGYLYNGQPAYENFSEYDDDERWYSLSSVTSNGYHTIEITNASGPDLDLYLSTTEFMDDVVASSENSGSNESITYRHDDEDNDLYVCVKRNSGTGDFTIRWDMDKALLEITSVSVNDKTGEKDFDQEIPATITVKVTILNSGDGPAPPFKIDIYRDELTEPLISMGTYAGDWYQTYDDNLETQGEVDITFDIFNNLTDRWNMWFMLSAQYNADEVSSEYEEYFRNRKFTWHFAPNNEDYGSPIYPHYVHHKINSTYGEYRTTQFHQGIDIAGAQGTNVWPVSTGEVAYWGSGFQIGHFKYAHLTNLNTDFFWDLENPWCISDYELVGKTNSDNHVHLEQHISDILNTDSDINPLLPGGFGYLSDSKDPVINDESSSFKIFRDGTESEISPVTVTGNVDFAVQARDKILYADNARRGVYHIQYKVYNTSMQQQGSTFTSFYFDSWLHYRDDDLLDVYTTNSMNNPGAGEYFEYIVTNNIGQNSFWNSRSVENGYYWIKIIAADVVGNWDYESFYIRVHNEDIQGPEMVSESGEDDPVWTIDASIGDPPYSYQWYKKDEGQSWSTAGSNSEELTLALETLTTDFELKVEYTDASYTYESEIQTVDLVSPPSVEFDGPSSIDFFDYNPVEWTANASGGVPPYSYDWYYTEEGQWYELEDGVQGNTYEIDYFDVWPFPFDFDLKVVVTDDFAQAGVDSYSVIVDNPPDLDGASVIGPREIDWIDGGTWYAFLFGELWSGDWTWYITPEGESTEEIEDDEYFTIEGQSEYDEDFTLSIEIEEGGQTYESEEIEVAVYGIEKRGAPVKPEGYALEQNYPNPFNPVTTIQYQLPEASHVTLVVYNIMGQEVARLADGYQSAGFYSAQWNASSVSSGIYLYRIEAGSFTAMKRMVVIK